MSKGDRSRMARVGDRLMDQALARLPPALRLRIGMARRLRDPRYLLGSQLAIEKRVLERSFREHLGYAPDLLDPCTFNEKLQWRKLFDRKPLLPRLIDKVQVRSYVESRVGNTPLIPLLHVSDSPSTIPFGRLSTPYIVKPNHASGVKVIVESGGEREQAEVEEAIGDSLRVPYGIFAVEWGYWNVRPRVVIEKLLLDEHGHLPPDFKIHCFNGEAHYIQVDTDRFSHHRCVMYDRDWTRLDLIRVGLPEGEDVPRPGNLREMIEFAEVLAAELDYVRVDVYSLGERIYFGEMTLYPSSGFRPFSPERWDLEWGALWTLPAPTRKA